MEEEATGSRTESPSDKNWETDFEALNGRRPKITEKGEYLEDIKKGCPPPDLNPISPHNEPGKRRTPKALADWEDDLAVIWAGSTSTIEFSYTNRKGQKSRRKVDPQELCIDRRNRLILIGFCRERGEKQTFSESSISTMIKVGSRRYDNLYEWVEEALDVDVSKLFECV